MSALVTYESDYILMSKPGPKHVYYKHVYQLPLLAKIKKHLQYEEAEADLYLKATLTVNHSFHLLLHLVVDFLLHTLLHSHFLVEPQLFQGQYGVTDTLFPVVGNMVLRQ